MPGENGEEELADIFRTDKTDGLLCSKCYAFSRNTLVLTCMHSFCDRCQSSCTPAAHKNTAAGIDIRKCPICSSATSSVLPGCLEFVSFQNGNLQTSPDIDTTTMTSLKPCVQHRGQHTSSKGQMTPNSGMIDTRFQKPTITGVTVIRSLGNSGKVKVTWDPCPGAFLYRTKFSNTDGNDNFFKEITFQQLKYPDTTSVVIDGLRNNCNYCISLQAVYPDGMSDFGEKHYVLTPQKINRTACFLSTDSKSMRIFVDSQSQTFASNCFTWNEDDKKEYAFFDRGMLRLFKGVTGNRWFGNNDCEYWEVAVKMYVKQRPRAKTDIFCLGIVQEDKRDEYSPLSSNIFSAGCALYKVAYKPSLALSWWNGGKWQPTADDKELINLHDAIYTTTMMRFGFLLDMTSRTLYVVDVVKNVLLNVFDHIKPTNCLPAFELFDDRTVDIEVRYITGPDVPRLPTVLSSEDNDFKFRESVKS
ncbi:uncharacterized protein LOC121377736 [Gigantopelta aegis]|uniref:uncharacterized protein LOC121377736 n=1 Tax=Gigantopelta aegis TaxID=1735272 RepID=UPI001B888E53|nr:uncharacterized protein LOC121377736 [Gigantopelta aegis]